MACLDWGPAKRCRRLLGRHLLVWLGCAGQYGCGLNSLLGACVACYACRVEVEAQEAVIEQLERRLAEGERRVGEARARAAAAEAAAAEKEGMLAYVGEEVERVKALFELKVQGCGGVGSPCAALRVPAMN